MDGRAGPSGGTTRTDESTSTSKLFCDSTSHEPLAFHLHTALPSKLKAELTHLIKSHGGKIHKRLIDLHRPFYALINPSSSQVPEYAAYVTSRPENERGTVVPYSFVRSSIIAREILRPSQFKSEHPGGHEGSAWAPLAFIRGFRRQGSSSAQVSLNGSTGDQAAVEDDGWGGLEPVAVHLHSTIGRAERRSLALDIAKAGGDPGSNAMEARVIVVDEDHAEFARLRKQYEHSLRTYVEPVTWITRCIAKGRYFHDPIEKAPMSGRKPGADRNDFTTEDDNNLARFIAKRIPDKSDGGRTGNNLYKDLCERTDIYPWAAGHTWQSWRNRYRKKQEYFDPIIDKYVSSRQDNGDGKGEFQYSRGKKRSAPAESVRAPSSRSPSVLSNTETAEGATTSRRKRPRAVNEATPTAVRGAPENRSSQRNTTSTSVASTSAGSTARRSQGTCSSRDRVRPSVAGARKRTKEPSQRESEGARRVGGSDMGRSSRQDQTERVRPDRSTTASQSQRDNVATTASTSRERLPTEVPETTSLLGMGMNMNSPTPNPVSEGTPLGPPGTSDAYGYDSDHEFHAKARDLGLSDYLGSGFTSTW